MSQLTWRFSALDSWFFRESRPHGALGNSQLGSMFPPPARTISGAVRTLIGEQASVDWKDFASDSPEQQCSIELKSVIGVGDNLRKLAFSGPWVVLDGDRLYPAPLYLFLTQDKEKITGVRLRVGKEVCCDLGQEEGSLLPVRLPELPLSVVSAKPAENIWVTKESLEKLLSGEVIHDGFFSANDLYREEPRLGIGINQDRGTVIEGQLYQTRHIRPHADMSIEMDIREGYEHTKLEQDTVVRFGGEGRLAAVSVVARGQCLPAAPISDAQTVGVILQLLTHANLDGGWLPSEFKPVNNDGIRCWEGEINQVKLTIHAAVIGKAYREGGWDLARQSPRAVCSLVPAGSVWYCTVEQDTTLEEAIRTLHGRSIGNDQALGRGVIAVGLLREDEFLNLEKEL